MEFPLRPHVVASVVTEWQRPGLWNLAPKEMGLTRVRGLMGKADTGSDLWVHGCREVRFTMHG